ncbi:MAG: zinc ribbon domain-containing protein [Haloarculaceae archaeon]
MSRGTDATVECPLCGTTFDPSVSGGWCTDPECGAWRRNGTTDSRTPRLATDGGPTVCPACGTEVAVEDNFCRVCGANVSGLDDSGRLGACPVCETEVEPADSFCRECGAHLDAHRPTTAESSPSDSGRSGTADGQQAGTRESASAAGRGDATDAGGGASDGQSDATAASTAAQGDRTADEPDAEPRLSLVARNRAVTVTDGDVVGKEIRSIIMDTGGDGEDAVRIHREHVRFEHEDGQFYLVDLGRNPTVVNGTELEQGDRVPVEPGDRIDLSGVAEIGVRQG